MRSCLVAVLEGGVVVVVVVGWWRHRERGLLISVAARNALPPRWSALAVSRHADGGIMGPICDWALPLNYFLPPLAPPFFLFIFFQIQGELNASVWEMRQAGSS